MMVAFILGVKLGKCNQAEMYGEHIEFDSLRFLCFTCHMASMEIKSLFHRKNLIQNIQRVIRNGGSFIMSKSLSYVG